MPLLHDCYLGTKLGWDFRFGKCSNVQAQTGSKDKTASSTRRLWLDRFWGDSCVLVKIRLQYCMPGDKSKIVENKN